MKFGLGIAAVAAALVVSACGVSTSSTGPDSPGDSASPSAVKPTHKGIETVKPAPTENWWPKKDRKVIYLTLDDGPGTNTEDALDVLKANDAQATFFLIGKMIRTREAMVQRIIDEGHAVGNHSWDHVDLSSLPKADVEWQLRKTSNAIGPVMGACFRPPFGAIDYQVRRVASQLGMQPVLWNIDTNDWKPGTAAGGVYSQLMTAGPGSVILVHDAGGDRSGTIEAMRKAIPKLKAQGYRFEQVPICAQGTRD